MMRSDTVSDSD